MAIKRYLPKYKKLLRFKYPLWFEKRVKIRKFEKQKWERVKRFYYPRKGRVYHQTRSGYPVARRFYKDRTIRLFKIYKFLLINKQKLQTYYGAGKFRYYQLKNMARKVQSKRKLLDSGKALLFALENRLDILLYRLLIVQSIPHARKLIQNKRVKVNLEVNTNSNCLLKPTQVISLDWLLKKRLLDMYLRSYTPYFFFRNRSKRTVLKEERRKVWEQPFVEKLSSFFLNGLKKRVEKKKICSRIFE
jgi:ribosomal protein S4